VINSWSNICIRHVNIQFFSTENFVVFLRELLRIIIMCRITSSAVLVYRLFYLRMKSSEFEGQSDIRCFIETDHTQRDKSITDPIPPKTRSSVKLMHNTTMINILRYPVRYIKIYSSYFGVVNSQPATTTHIHDLSCC
jgi:hypothetical protein